jgi:hypothetical protein
MTVGQDDRQLFKTTQREPLYQSVVIIAPDRRSARWY